MIEVLREELNGKKRESRTTLGIVDRKNCAIFVHFLGMLLTFISIDWRICDVDERKREV